MTSRQNFLTISMAVCVAGYVALTVDFFAHRGLGFSTEHIRDVAFGSATMVAWLLAIDHFGKKWRRPKHQIEHQIESKIENRSNRVDE